MGTNYYTRINECEYCGRSEIIHLGKSSGGWTFSFQYNDGLYYKNVEEMKEWLSDKIIKDEYGSVVENKDFWKLVKYKQKKGNLSHAEKYPQGNLVIDGYSFSNYEFC